MLTQLEPLSLTENRLVSIRSEVGTLTNLKVLALENKESDSGVSAQQEIYDPSGLGLIEFPPEILTEHTELTSLSLSRNNLTRLPDSIDTPTVLQALHIEDNPVTRHF